MNFPDNLKYTSDHEWIRVEGDSGWVGITDYAQSELGDVVFVELPAVGTKVAQGKSMGTIEAVKAVSDLFAPVSGEVLEVNKEIVSSPDALNKDPYGKGWMIKMRIGNPAELAALLDVGAYQKTVAK
ncbi:MAG: glycine cleavage system protein GcvH [Ignavibacteriales bacterium]|nr:glycine cleavage system protein GcvH [Ignavibacteriales bacterium]